MNADEIKKSIAKAEQDGLRLAIVLNRRQVSGRGRILSIIALCLSAASIGMCLARILLEK